MLVAHNLRASAVIFPCLSIRLFVEKMHHLSIAILGMLVAHNLAATLKAKNKAKLDINQKAYVEGQPVLGDGTGEGALNVCRSFAEYMVTNPSKPEVKVCGTGIKMTVYLLGRCGEGSLNSANMAHQWEVGACDSGLNPKTCEGFGPDIDPRMGASQSYKITQC